MADNLDQHIREYLASVFNPLLVPLVPVAMGEPNVIPCYMVDVGYATARGLDQSTSEYNPASGAVRVVTQQVSARVWTQVQADVESSGLLNAAMDDVVEQLRACIDQAPEMEGYDGGAYFASYDALAWNTILRAPDDESNKGSITIEGLLTYIVE